MFLAGSNKNVALRNCVILQQKITVIFTHTLDVKAGIIHHNSIHKGAYIDYYFITLVPIIGT